MMDSILHSGYSLTAGVQTQMTAGGTSTVVDTGNASPRLIAPSGATRGLPLDGRYASDQVMGGRLSLGMLQAAVIILVLVYLWTRNVQGGG